MTTKVAPTPKAKETRSPQQTSQNTFKGKIVVGNEMDLRLLGPKEAEAYVRRRGDDKILFYRRHSNPNKTLGGFVYAGRYDIKPSGSLSLREASIQDISNVVNTVYLSPKVIVSFGTTIDGQSKIDGETYVVQSRISDSKISADESSMIEVVFTKLVGKKISGRGIINEGEPTGKLEISSKGSMDSNYPYLAQNNAAPTDESGFPTFELKKHKDVKRTIN